MNHEIKRIAFVIDQKQDFYLSLSFLFLLKGKIPEGKNQISTLALIINEENVSEFEPYLYLFDQFSVIGRCVISPNPLTVRKFVKRFAEKVKGLSLNDKDIVVAFSFREFFMNVLIRNLKPRPKLVCVRKCDYEVDAQCTKKKTVTSLYRNFSNILYGYSLMKYQWHPETDRIFTHFFVRNPYDFEFCMNPIQSLRNDGSQIPYPFSILREHAKELRAVSEQPSIVVLGELYPFFEGMDMDRFMAIFNRFLSFIRQEFPHHKLIFKPRVDITNLDLDLQSFTVAFQNVSLESLLTRVLNIEKVFSFKSSGSFLANLFGSEGYLLYPMLDLPRDIRQSLDVYFSPFKGLVNFVHELDDIKKEHEMDLKHISDKIKQASRYFIDVLVATDAKQPEAKKPRI